ncbi:MAG: hypothetical protein VB080_15225 [Propionicimonas sp.]|uniref:hypothetical protein n=1 Tax=Propionicimonas sp. TaxID=1955623 RepID=UPI002B205C4F|nr:hypothetical protein [Propionicimonas sp.]MEA4945773.1 hypothetical protein [Propionicimonas sp.]
MILKLRSAALLVPLAVSVLTLAGCASSAPIAADPSPTAGESGMQTAAAWLDAGRIIGVVTWGSSTCVPTADAATASGQEITVTLTDNAEGACTADYAPRASEVAVPAGVDPKQDVTVHLTYLDQTVDLTLAGDPGLTGTPGEPTDYQPTAGWFTDQGIALLTWGSSTCRPQPAKVDETADGITVSFTPHDGACTMDMVPRLTVISVEGGDHDRNLTLVGDNLDATIPIVG